ncbi:MAG: ferrochelatase [Candidatus Kariarchaeaceae archaeon]
MQEKEGKLGIVLLNMGGPADINSVRPFLYELFSDQEIINFPKFLRPFQKPIAWLIAKFRAPKTKQMYDAIGGGSPIKKITEDLAISLENELIENGVPSKVVVSMRYAEPRSNEAISILERENIEKLVLFSQYPHYAKSTSGSSLNDFYTNIPKESFLNSIETIEIDDWGLEDEYISWWVAKIKEKLDATEILDNSIHIIFSAHGIPKKYVEAGEKYPERIEAAYYKILNQLGKVRTQVATHLAYQSRAGPVEWTQPYTDKLLIKIGQLEPSKVIIVPLGFVSNHVETLYEIDILFANIAKENGISDFSRVEVPDSDPLYAKNMSKLIVKRLKRRI